MSVISIDAAQREPLSREPYVRAAPAESLGLEQMPTETHFRRDHFAPPALATDSWRLGLDGPDGRHEISFDDVTRLPRRELAVVLECAGHRRSEFEPAARGLRWQIGAVSEAMWAGTSLSNVLELAGFAGGRFVVLEGADHGPFRGTGDFAFARALPIAKALHPDTLLAWEMNDEPLPFGHGAPLRAIVPGWYATDSIKWLQRIRVLDESFDGPFEAIDYRLPAADGSSGSRLMQLPVHALLVSPDDGEELADGEIDLRGIAWGGEGGVARVDVAIDGGAWEEADLTPPAGRYGRTHWTFAWRAEAGSHAISVRATDAAGNSQPPMPAWNEGGYANSGTQHVTFRVA
jgi:DMSO/TMAO reductase YedYZ molybdopterin-dependent catalytic subunit